MVDDLDHTTLRPEKEWNINMANHVTIYYLDNIIDSRRYCRWNLSDHRDLHADIRHGVPNRHALQDVLLTSNGNDRCRSLCVAIYYLVLICVKEKIYLQFKKNTCVFLIPTSSPSYQPKDGGFWT